MKLSFKTILIFCLITFIYSGLIKWIQFPLDPTLLFFIISAALSLLYAFRARIYRKVVITVVLFLFLFVWIGITCFYTVSDEYWKEKLLRSLISIPSFLFPLLILAKEDDFIKLRKIYAFLLIAGLGLLTYEYFDNALARLIGNNPDETKIPEYLNISIFLATGSLFMLSMPGRLKYPIIAGSALFIILLGARAPFIFLVTSFLLFFLLRGYLKHLTLAFITIVLFLVFSSSIPIFERLISRLSGVPLIGSTVDSSVGGRLQVYRLSYSVIQDHPILGTGLGGFSAEVYGNDEVSAIHNIFLEIWVELGLVGLTILLFFMLSVLFHLVNLYKDHHANLFALSLICICCFHFLELLVSSKMEDWRVPLFWLGGTIAYYNHLLIKK